MTLTHSCVAILCMGICVCRSWCSPSPAPPSSPASVDLGLGAPSSVRSAGRTGVGEEHLDLWYALVEWVSESETLDSGVVLAWDSEEVGERVLALPHCPALSDTLAVRQAERKAKRIEAARAKQAQLRAAAAEKEMKAAGADAPTPLELQPLHAADAPSTPTAATAAAAAASPAARPSSGASHSFALAPLPSHVTIPFALAQELLGVDRSLAALRHSTVPSRVSEDAFWDAYFAAVLATVRQHVLSLQQPPEQLQDTNPALESIGQAQTAAQK